MSKNEPQPELPIPPGNGNGDPPPRPPRITSIAPIGGLLTGGYDVALTGTGFQPGAEVFFGAVASPEVQVTSFGRVTAKVPPATQVGTVSVSLVNPDGESALAPGGFTYVSSEGSLHAEVLGVSPLSVIESTETEVTIRGRNLISAYNDGIVALRGPSRVQCAFSNFGSTTDSETGIDSLILTVRVIATPPLEQHERIGIQVLASLRPDAANNGIFTSSRQMFTVLPRAVPVTLAFTANLDPGRPNLVIVAGRNLEGISLDLGGGATIHSQRSDDRTIAAVVSFPEGAPSTESLPLQLLDPAGQSAGQFDVTFVQSLESVKSTSSVDGTVMAAAEPGGGDVGLTLTPVPGQQLTGPTKEDSATFSLKSGESLFPSWGFEAFFFYAEFDIDILIPLFNEVRLIPFFDNGVGDFIDNTPVVAEVGKLFRLRGVGLLVTLRVDLIIHIHVVIIIGIIFFPWDFGFFNEFGFDFPFGIGSIVVSISVTVNIFLSLAFMVALVEPLGRLRVLFFFNLELGIDFFFSADNSILHFNTNLHFKVNYTRVFPFHSLLPCDGRFQLAEENGQTAFTDNSGSTVAFYLPRAAGPCCLTWDFQLRLVQFEQEGGPEEILQDSFRADYCLNATPPTNVVNIIVTSEHPAPTGIGLDRRLEMTFDDRAALIALAQPAEEDGTPTGPPEDVRNLGYDPEFYIEPLHPDLFNPVLLPSGDAIPVQAGENTIHVILHPRGETPQFFSFRPADIFGFVIQRFVSQGLLPAFIAGALPVTVQDPTKIIVKPTLAYRDAQNHLVESPSLFVNQGEPVREIERYEPFEYDDGNPPQPPQPLQRDYSLAARISFPPGAPFPQKLTLTIDRFEMKVLIGNNAVPEVKAPLENTNFIDGTGDTDVTHFFAKRVAAQQEVEVELTSRPSANELIELKDTNRQPNRSFKIAPHIRQESATHLVPPGKLVADRHVMLFVDMTATSDRGTDVDNIKQLKMAVRNDETYEEYLRAIPQTRALVTGTYASFVKTFFNTLPAAGPPTAGELAAKGLELWNTAVTDVQTSKDDRPLYWARLQSICALRAYYHRNRFGNPPVTQFEWPSRGLDPDGAVSFGTIAATDRKVIVTGFDPFQLPTQPDQSNPSGMLALILSNKKVDQVSPDTYAATAIFPVRYRDFDDGLVEKAVKKVLTPQFALVRMLMTLSLNNSDYFDVERWACQFRVTTTNDNEGKKPTNVVAGAKSFYQNTMPYERVITSTDSTRRLQGPARTSTPFVTDQSYKVAGASGNRQRGLSPSPVVEGSYRPEPIDDGTVHNAAAYEKQFDQPIGFSLEGSGGSYLSNEIFYRSARERDDGTRKSLASGHLHIPFVSPSTTWDRDRMINGVKEALRRMLNNVLALRIAAGAADLPITPVTRTSQITLMVTNDSPAAVNLTAAEVPAPFAVAIVGAVPVAVAANGSVTLNISFSPTALGDFRGEVLLKDGAAVIGSFTLVGRASPTPPGPTITSISPTQGIIGDAVTIVGTNLDGATSVRVGSVGFSISSSAPTQIEAEVMGPPRVGPITVTTPSGTTSSSQTFRVVRGPRIPPDDLATQLSERRAELGLSPQQAATQMGTRSATYRRWERGLDRPSRRFHTAIVNFLGHDPEPDPRELGERIRAARERDGLTRSQLAERLDVSSSTVRAWETGEVSRPSPRVLDIFENYLQEE